MSENRSVTNSCDTTAHKEFLPKQDSGYSTVG